MDHRPGVCAALRLATSAIPRLRPATPAQRSRAMAQALRPQSALWHLLRQARGARLALTGVSQSKPPMSPGSDRTPTACRLSSSTEGYVVKSTCGSGRNYFPGRGRWTAKEQARRFRRWLRPAAASASGATLRCVRGFLSSGCSPARKTSTSSTCDAMTAVVTMAFVPGAGNPSRPPELICRRW